MSLFSSSPIDESHGWLALEGILERYFCLVNGRDWWLITKIPSSRYHRGPFRSQARPRWCKPCGVRTGQAQVGKWYWEANLDGRDRDHQTAEESTLYLRGGLRCLRCSKRDRPWELLWGCGDCFRKEKARRRDAELLKACEGRQLPAVTAAWLKKRLGGRSRSRNQPDMEGKVLIDRSALPSCGQMARRETRCEDCWRFPTRIKGGEADAVFDELDSRFWCDACQATLRKAAMENREKVRRFTSVR